MPFGSEKIDFSKLKTLIVMLNDNISGSVKYFYPKSLEDIEDYAEFVRYVITPEDVVVSVDGVEERTFEIYRDLGRQNLYYLIQKSPLDISNELDFILNKDAGVVNTQKILKDRYFAVLEAIKRDIINEFEAFIFLRFQFTSEPVSIVSYAMSRDFKNRIPLIFPDVAPQPLDFSLKMRASILTPTVNLYLLMPNRKVFYDFAVSTIKISKVVDNKITYVVELDEYLDSFFKMVLQTLYPLQ